MKQNYTERDLLQKCLRQIEKRLGWGPSKEWHNEVFNELSEAIHQQVDVMLSPTTLKRVWGRVSYKSRPSISTLNALAQFAGYENWRAFKNQGQIAKREAAKPEKKSMSSRGIVLTSAAFMTIVFISIYSMIGSDSAAPIAKDYSQVQFSSRPIAKGLPNSVVFDLNLADITSESIYIQQYWDPNKTIKVNAGQQQATGIYYRPGYFRAKLLVDGQIIREHDLFIKSHGWMATLDYKPVPKYIYDVRQDKPFLSLPVSIINEIKASSTPLKSGYHYVDELGDISADHFTLDTRFRSIYNDKWAVCQSTQIVILGTTGAMVIPFSIPGCVSDIGLMLNDIYLDGKEHDLSAFGTDLSDYKRVKIHVQDKRVKVYIDQEEVYTGRYQEAVGQLVGIRYRFLGAGEVASLKIMNSEGEVALEGE